MAISERRRLTFTTIAVILLAILTWLLIYGVLLSPPTTTPTTTAPTTTTPTLALDSGEVDILDNAFVPITITVTVGATVTWTNLGREDHTATSDAVPFDSGLLWFGHSFSYTFTQPGVFYYYCNAHDDMSGTVFVE